jgi:hypothetical protein
MTDITTLLTRIDAHIAKTEAARSTVSKKLFGSGTRLDQIAGGANVTYRVITAASEKLNQLEQGA